MLKVLTLAPSSCCCIASKRWADAHANVNVKLGGVFPDSDAVQVAITIVSYVFKCMTENEMLMLNPCSHTALALQLN